MSAESTIEINVLYFANLADESGCDEESLAIANTMSLSQLYDHLQQKHRLSVPQSELRVAINDYFVSWDEPIKAGDNVVFISPVAGG